MSRDSRGLRARVVRSAAVAVLALAAAGCGGGSAPALAPAPTVTALTFNQTDVDFAAHMSQHHGQALVMTELAAAKARSAQVRGLALRIAQQRAPEVDQFGAWLAAWGEAGGQMPPHGIGADHSGPGMLEEAVVSRLGGLSPRNFDRTFVDLMVRHHRGGMKLTEKEIAEGANPDAVALARNIRAATAATVAELLKIGKGLAR